MAAKYFNIDNNHELILEAIKMQPKVVKHFRSSYEYGKKYETIAINTHWFNKKFGVFSCLIKPLYYQFVE